jgi:predicted metal-dependent phosphoesterase TrpH
MGAEAAKSYATKKTTGKFNAHKSKYTDAQIERIKATNAEYLYYFGYANHPDQENHTAFFEFKDHKPEHLEQFYGYRKDNEKFLKQLAKEGGWKGPKYGVNTTKFGAFDVIPKDKLEYLQYPSRDWA